MYITTTLPYINALPHMGHVFEFVHADVMTRTFRLQGHEVFFNTGTDEHGIKVLREAEKRGVDPKIYTDEMSEKFKEIQERVLVHPTRFIRTTEEVNKNAARHIWKICKEKGLIYKKKYKALYCVGCELFKKDAELEKGICPLHPTLSLEEVEEENYFFKLSHFQKDLLSHYDSNPYFIEPSSRMKELYTFVSNGLEDISVSRDTTRVPWGVKVPDDPSQVLYVWFDALSNYIASIGYPDGDWKKYWPGIQIAGKDNLRQQGCIWQALLRAIDAPFSEKIYIHGFITQNGKKMSKTLKNTIDPNDIVKHYGADAFRYILLSLHSFEDADISEEYMHRVYTADLVNGYGNLSSRILTLSEKYSTHSPRTPSPHEDVLTALTTYRFKDAIDLIRDYMKKMDGYIQSNQPFRVVREDPERGKEMITQCLQNLANITETLSPILPHTSTIVREHIKKNTAPHPLFPRLERRK